MGHCYGLELLWVMLLVALVKAPHCSPPFCERNLVKNPIDSRVFPLFGWFSISLLHL